MYYDRTLKILSPLLEKGGLYRWLFDYVFTNNELDFLIGKNSDKEWISIYRGLSRILSISSSNDNDKYKIDADAAYKQIAKDAGLKIYGKGEDVKLSVENLNIMISNISKIDKFNHYYNNMKEGYYQNILSRRYGICGKPDDEFVIIDKEVVIGYADTQERDSVFGSLRDGYKKRQKILSDCNPKRYGRDLIKKAIGGELDFLALNKEGDLLLVEYKHGTNTSGIYLSPLQIGLYQDVFVNYHKIKGIDTAVFSMLEQKQKIGLVNPNWSKPHKIGRILPVLIISEYNDRSSAKDKFIEVLKIMRQEKHDSLFLEGMRIYNYKNGSGLIDLNWPV